MFFDKNNTTHRVLLFAADTVANIAITVIWEFVT